MPVRVGRGDPDLPVGVGAREHVDERGEILAKAGLLLAHRRGVVDHEQDVGRDLLAALREPLRALELDQALLGARWEQRGEEQGPAELSHAVA